MGQRWFVMQEGMVTLLDALIIIQAATDWVDSVGDAS